MAASWTSSDNVATVTEKANGGVLSNPLSLRAIEAAVSGMTRDENDIEAQEVGCESLVGIIEESDEPEKVKLAIARLGGIKAVVDALRRHSNDFRMPEAGCHVLAKLAEGSQTQICESLLERGGVEAVLKSMMLYPGESKVQQAGAEVLASVAEGSRERQELVASMGGVHAVMLAMIHYEEVRPTGLRFLILLDKKELDDAGAALCKEKGSERMEKALSEIEQEVLNAGGSRARGMQLCTCTLFRCF